MHRIAPGGLPLLLLLAVPAVASPEDKPAPDPSARASAAAAPSAQATKQIDVSEGYYPEEDPPPGTPADVALWRSGFEVSRALRGAKAEAERVNRRAHFSRVEGRLKTAARSATPDEAARYEQLLGSFHDAWRDQFTLMWSRWPVDPVRACDDQILAFGSVLRATAGGTRKGDVSSARERLRSCVERGKGAASAMTRKNQALAAAIDAGLAATAELDAAARGATGAQPGPGKAELGEAHEKGEKGEAHEKGEHEMPKPGVR